jgi:F-box interacting protein
VINLEFFVPGQPSKKMKSKTETELPELPEAMVLEILIRLPVKSLLRFKTASKPWRAMISDPSFIRRQLQHSASKWKQNPSLLITPHAVGNERRGVGAEWPMNFSTQIRMYQWQPDSVSTARYMLDKDFNGEFNAVSQFIHCDGLVLLPTDRKVYVFNPATRDTLALPDGDGYEIEPDICTLPAGLGLAPVTLRYKVVRAFYRSNNYSRRDFRMGMQVYTIGDAAAAWRDTPTDPPYPVVERPWAGPQSVNGKMFWIINLKKIKPLRPRCLLSFNIEDETFGTTRLPSSLDPALEFVFRLGVMHGELCLTAPSSAKPGPQPQIVWALVHEDGMNSRWEQRYSIGMSQDGRPLALLAPDMLLWYARRRLYRYHLRTGEVEDLVDMNDGLRYQRRRHRAGSFESAGPNVYFFNVMPYMESLVRLTA